MKSNSRDIILVNPTKTMSTVQLHKLKKPMQDAFPGNSLLFMWTKGANLRRTIRLMEAWGWKFRTIAFTWTKLRLAHRERFLKLAHSVQFGMPLSDTELIPSLENLFLHIAGKYSRTSTEFVILGQRGGRAGRMPRMSTTTRELIVDTPSTAGMPQEVNRRIERLYRRPQDHVFELFSTRQYEDWVCTGIPVDGLNINQALSKLGMGMTWNAEETRHDYEEFCLNKLRILMKDEPND